ncbi:hypothetical protein AXG55_07140 [Silvanigrella aquatica]|uniref:Peptidase M12A domain-containing protein n=2 Tax=Silvanigrella aquatica TaxID=1915309 RepID=A0A1L4D0G1_9BACT|nr:hypothetical protein AXG55_07140 [Silvanigrella aquatica]
MQGGNQKLILNSKKCMKLGTILHELMHSLGFYHEQSRYDRDRYIIVHWDNINTEKIQNFEKKGEFTTRFGENDYDSIMNYSSYGFTQKGNCPIEAKRQHEIGQRKGLSQTDIYGLWLAYGEKSEY